MGILRRIKERYMPKTLKSQMRFWSVTIILLFGIISIISFIFIEYSSEKKHAIEYIDDTIRAQGIYIDNWFNERLTDISVIANSEDARTINIEGLIKQFNNLSTQKQDFRNLHYIDKNGDIVVTTMADAQKYNVSDREYFKDTMEGKDHISGVSVGKVEGNLLVFIASPVRDYNNNIQGLILSTVSLESIDKVIDDIGNWKGRDTYLIDRNGYMITESRYLKELINKGIVEKTARMQMKIDNTLMNKLIDENLKPTFYTNYRGMTALGSFKWVNNGRWLIVSEIYRDELINMIIGPLFLIVPSMMILIVSAIFITFKLTNKFEEPIEHLLRGTEIIQKGKYNDVIDMRKMKYAPIELKRLCKAFNKMSITIQSNMMEIEESKQRYRALFYHNPDTVYAVDKDGCFIELNASAGSITGFNINQLIGKHYSGFVIDEDLEKCKNYFNKAIGEEPQNYDLRIWSKEGEKREVNVTSIPIIIKDEVVGLYGIIKDVTDKKKAQRELVETARKLEESNEDLKQFAYIASHDLQEPLRMVINYLQLIERRYRGKLDEDADDFIGYAVGGAKRMQKLIKDLLSYSRVNTRGNEFIHVESKEIIETVLDNLALLIQDKNAEITYEELPAIYGDETQLIQLFQNLINNSIKFNDKTIPMVHISVKDEGDKFLFKVEDNGIGIPADQRDRIFTIFQRLHTSDEYSGTGIGLSICKRIIERHRGNIWVQSEEGKKTIFFFIIPKN